MASFGRSWQSFGQGNGQGISPRSGRVSKAPAFGFHSDLARYVGIKVMHSRVPLSLLGLYASPALNRADL
jgi:hypothetical protein